MNSKTSPDKEEKKQKRFEPPQTAKASNSRKIQLNLMNQEDDDTQANTMEMEFMSSNGQQLTEKERF